MRTMPKWLADTSSAKYATAVAAATAFVASQRYARHSVDDQQLDNDSSLSAGNRSTTASQRHLAKYTQRSSANHDGHRHGHHALAHSRLAVGADACRQ